MAAPATHSKPKSARRAAVKSAKVEALSLRVDPQTRFLIDRAADALGQTRTEFMLSTARSRATEVLLGQRLFVLNDADWTSFNRALDAPTPSNTKLKALLARRPAWDRP
jgi:uncharacterized protein (DUF1778 family)